MTTALTAKQKTKVLKTVHQKVKLFRAKEPLLSVFMWGINHSVCILPPLLSILSFLNLIAILEDS